MDKVIVQLRADSTSDIDRFFRLEESLFQAFSQCSDGYVDGHDIGEGRFNIFIHVRGPWSAVLARVEAFLKLHGAFGEVVIAKFYGKSERYQVVHPPAHIGGFAL